jgi:hypothetical protein
MVSAVQVLEEVPNTLLEIDVFHVEEVPCREFELKEGDVFCDVLARAQRYGFVGPRMHQENLAKLVGSELLLQVGEIKIAADQRGLVILIVDSSADGGGNELVWSEVIFVRFRHGNEVSCHAFLIPGLATCFIRELSIVVIGAWLTEWQY